MEWFTTTNQGPNLWSLARSFDVPKQPGAKLSTRKRSRLAHPKAISSSRVMQNSPNHAKVMQPTNTQQSYLDTSTSRPSYITGLTFMGPSQFSFPSPFSGPNKWSYNNYYPCNPYLPPYHQPPYDVYHQPPYHQSAYY